ncbi:hypothetical protein A4A49_65166 [Nicotiana attenuata]|uniref:Uncharacterized protein n=1 Tax=Nicotiana attenuata TaxID=49451 RepID=A0A1J6IJN6_NICAT|nr:hypothetical protein A4A49_65166 [Nicotiana attenuata]
MWNRFDPDLLSYKDLCEEFTKELGFIEVKQFLVAGSSGRFYIIDGDDVSENEHVIGDYDFDVDAPSNVEYDSEGLEVISKQRRRVVSDRLENFKELDKGMTFKDIVEARRVVNYYAIANGCQTMPIIKMLENIRIKGSGAGLGSKKGKAVDNTPTLTSSEDETHEFGEAFFGSEVGTQQSQQLVLNTQAGTQEFNSYGPHVGDDEDPTIRPVVISENDTILAMRKVQMIATGTKRIQFTGDETGAATPTNLPYSPTNATWNGKPAITSSQHQAEVRKKKYKMKARKGQGEQADD